ncbi:hypothetical protein ABT010_25315 [Streptomyces sp. NPDC002668]|uniref:hypothetical protein n=1 Tax=Streptomyces sp. NPDC002668 TaxID=3154422 RepID=UPI003324CBC5
MIWWLRIRAAPAVLAALLVVAAVATLARSSEVAVPSVVGGLTTGLPLRFLAPVLPVLLILYGQARADRALEQVSARDVRWLDPAFALAFVVLALLASAVVPDGFAVTRNIAGYLGIALLLRWVSTLRLAMAVTAILPFAVASLGGHRSNPAWWAWPLHSGDEPMAAVGALILFSLGLGSGFLKPLRADARETVN